MLALVYFIPVMTSLLWLVTFLFKADKQRRKAYVLTLAGAFLAIYIHLLRTGKHPRWMFALLFVPAIIIGSTVGVLYYLIGFENAAFVTSSFLSDWTLPAGYDGDLYRIYILLSRP